MYPSASSVPTDDQLRQTGQPILGIGLEHLWSVGNQSSQQQTNVLVSFAAVELLVHACHPLRHLRRCSTLHYMYLEH